MRSRGSLSLGLVSWPEPFQITLQKQTDRCLMRAYDYHGLHPSFPADPLSSLVIVLWAVIRSARVHQQHTQTGQTY